MTRRRPAWLLFLSFLCFAPASNARASKVSELLVRLRSDDVFERQLAEAELRQLDPESLLSLSRAVTEFSPPHSPPDPHSPPEGGTVTRSIADRNTRFRAGVLLSEMLQDLLMDFEREQQAYNLDEASRKRLERRRQSAAAGKKLARKLKELRAADPEIDVKLQELADLTALERLINARREQDWVGPLTPETAARMSEATKTLEKLREKRRAWVAADPRILDTMAPLLELYRERQLGDGRELSQVEELHLGELAERVEERRPRVERLRQQVWDIGLPALNEALVRRQTIRPALRPFYDQLVSRGLERFSASDVDGEEFEIVRYTRGLLWAWEAGRSDQGPGQDNQRSQELLARHLEKVLEDLSAKDTIVRERAAEELFLLEERGRQALASAGNAAATGDEAPTQHGFLIELLRWRIRPSTYTRVGIHFGDFPELSFRRKRRKIFDYTKVASEQAITTLRAIIVNDELEASFLVKLAAAKALAGLRDLSGYEYLVINHPELTMKKPEVSREILIIQGYDYIRDKQYRLAIDELRKVLDEYPFDFRANYHIAFAYLLLKDHEKSVHHFEIARRINPKDQLTLYNLACAYSLHGDVDQAIEALEESVKAGFTDYDHIEKDSDLEALRDHRRYRNLLKRMRSASE